MSDPLLQKHTLFLREGDMKFLQETLPRGKASHAIRKLVSNFVDHIRESVDTTVPPAPTDL